MYLKPLKPSRSLKLLSIGRTENASWFIQKYERSQLIRLELTQDEAITLAHLILENSSKE